jgi:hypothetical protein
VAKKSVTEEKMKRQTARTEGNKDEWKMARKEEEKQEKRLMGRKRLEEADWKGKKKETM